MHDHTSSDGKKIKMAPMRSCVAVSGYTTVLTTFADNINREESN